MKRKRHTYKYSVTSIVCVCGGGSSGARCPNTLRLVDQVLQFRTAAVWPDWLAAAARGWKPQISVFPAAPGRERSPPGAKGQIWNRDHVEPYAARHERCWGYCTGREARDNRASHCPQQKASGSLQKCAIKFCIKISRACV